MERLRHQGNEAVIKVFFVGMDIRSEQAVMERLQGIGDSTPIGMQVCNDLAECNLLVVHRDSPVRRAINRIIHDRPSLPSWLLGADGALSDGTHAPDTPLGDDAIREALSRIINEASGSPAPAGTTPPPAPRAAAATQQSSESADIGPAGAALARALQQKISDGQGAAALDLDGHPLALLDFSTGMAVSGIEAGEELEPLAQALAVSFHRLTLEPLPPGHVSPPGMNDPSALSLQRLLWRTGLQLHGQLLAPDSAAMRLPAWPDFRMLAHQHDHFRLCSLLLRRACTPAEAGRLLDLPLPRVQSFFNAAWVSGHGELAQPADAPAASTTRKGAGSLLASMWRRVRGRVAV